MVTFTTGAGEARPICERVGDGEEEDDEEMMMAEAALRTMDGEAGRSEGGEAMLRRLTRGIFDVSRNPNKWGKDETRETSV